MIVYKQYKKIDSSFVKDKIKLFLEEDLPFGDKTTLGTITSTESILAEIQAGESLVFAGEQIIPHCFDNNTTVDLMVKDGDQLDNGDLIGTIIGQPSTILSRERVMLNLIQRLCGIATQAKAYANISTGTNVKILDTRKTTPGLRLFEKYAVTCGGCYNHRLNLSDGVLIKDNHLIAAKSVRNAVKNIVKIDNSLPIELEVDTMNQIYEGLNAKVDGFLLDNMKPEQIIKAVQIIRNNINGKNVLIEASGGITLKNIEGYLTTGIDAISIGALTHQVTSKDIRLEFID